MATLLSAPVETDGCHRLLWTGDTGAHASLSDTETGRRRVALEQVEIRSSGRKHPRNWSNSNSTATNPASSSVSRRPCSRSPPTGRLNRCQSAAKHRHRPIGKLNQELFRRLIKCRDQSRCPDRGGIGPCTESFAGNHACIAFSNDSGRDADQNIGTGTVRGQLGVKVDQLCHDGVVSAAG